MSGLAIFGEWPLPFCLSWVAPPHKMRVGLKVEEKYENKGTFNVTYVECSALTNEGLDTV